MDGLAVGLPQEFNEADHAHGDTGDVATLSHESVEERKGRTVDLHRANSKNQFPQRPAVEESRQQREVNPRPAERHPQRARKGASAAQEGAAGGPFRGDFCFQVVDLHPQHVCRRQQLSIRGLRVDHHGLLHRRTFGLAREHLQIQLLAPHEGPMPEHQDRHADKDDADHSTDPASQIEHHRRGLLVPQQHHQHRAGRDRQNRPREQGEQPDHHQIKHHRPQSFPRFGERQPEHGGGDRQRFRPHFSPVGQRLHHGIISHRY